MKCTIIGLTVKLLVDFPIVFRTYTFIVCLGAFTRIGGVGNGYNRFIAPRFTLGSEDFYEHAVRRFRLPSHFAIIGTEKTSFRPW